MLTTQDIRLFPFIECSIVKVKVDNKLASLRRTQMNLGPHLVLNLQICTANLTTPFATNFKYRY